MFLLMILKIADLIGEKDLNLWSTLDTAMWKSDSVIEGNEKRKFKIPCLELKENSCKSKFYLIFWAQFEKMHLDPEMVEDDKFQYLIKCMIVWSTAARLVDSFPSTKEMTSKFIIQFKKCFDWDDLLAQIYERDIMALVMHNATLSFPKWTFFCGIAN